VSADENFIPAPTPLGFARERVDDGDLRLLVECQYQTELHRLPLDDGLHLLPAQGKELMHEALHLLQSRPLN
jgi:hypothetical protein